MLTSAAQSPVYMCGQQVPPLSETVALYIIYAIVAYVVVVNRELLIGGRRTRISVPAPPGQPQPLLSLYLSQPTTCWSLLSWPAVNTMCCSSSLVHLLDCQQ
jgi:hypothetical protein